MRCQFSGSVMLTGQSPGGKATSQPGKIGLEKVFHLRAIVQKTDFKGVIETTGNPLNFPSLENRVELGTSVELSNSRDRPRVYSGKGTKHHFDPGENGRRNWDILGADFQNLCSPSICYIIG